jgi:hypothetical protein
MPLYRELFAASTRASTFDLVFDSFVSLDDLAEYLHGHDLAAARRMALTLPEAVTGTPALIAVDAHGRVIKSWMGQLSSDQEADLRRVIGSL